MNAKAPSKIIHGFFHPEGCYFPGCDGLDLCESYVAVVACVNEDDTYNLSCLAHDGGSFFVKNIPTKQHADEGVWYFEPRT
jgi:hypothetical protein